MFNAIFGNFLFSNKSTEPVVDTVPEEEQTNGKCEASTQTTSISIQASLVGGEKLGVGSNDDKHVLTDTRASGTATSNPLDWVIIDPSEGSMMMDVSQLEKSNQGDNLVDMGCNTDATIIEASQKDKQEKSNDDDGDVLLGSFFDKNERDESDLSSGHLICSKIFRSGLGLSNDDNNESDNDANEAEEETKVEAPAKRDETWLITPLPCLTSITESSNQRSMIDNYPLENLLIEHPSMSVFISATTQNNSLPVATCSTRQQNLSQSLPLINASNQIEVTQLEDICSNEMTAKAQETIEMFCLNKSNKIKRKQKKASKKNHRVPKRNVPRRSVRFDMKQEPATEFDLEPIIFTICDDREEEHRALVKVEEQVAQVEKEEVVSEVVELEPAVEIVEATVLQQIAVVEQQIDSANSSISSSGKKSRRAKKAKSAAASTQAKSSVKSSSNKENMQVKTLLMNEVKKCSVSHGSVNHTRFELTYNTNQMKRNNKNCFSMRNVNIQQRKYHKLQQPSFSFNIQQF